MSRCIVTGAAGFIGSHLCEALVAQGFDVLGIDSLTDYYSNTQKRNNVAKLCSKDNFTLVEEDILEVNLKKLLRGRDYIFHLAAQPGVRASWGENFDIYVRNNILATQRLLEVAKKAQHLKRFVFASSSSIYGDAECFPTSEDVNPRPVSPYGVSKLAAEKLCYLYWKNYGVPTVSLRYFTVYGPRQRPDMAFHKFMQAVVQNTEIEIYGDGKQTRDFTYVADAVQGTLAAAFCADNKVCGQAFNIGGGSRISVNEVLGVLREVTLKECPIRHIEKQYGDVQHTSADIARACNILGYQPCVTLQEGLEKEWSWIKRSESPYVASKRSGVCY